MDRRVFFKWTGLATLGLALTSCSRNIVSVAANRYYNGPVTDNFDGTYFYNIENQVNGSTLDFLRWKITEKREKWPEHYPSPYPVAVPQPYVSTKAVKVTMVGHATLLIQSQGLNILTDPVYSDRVSPLHYIGPKRHNPPGIAFEKLPKIDLILVTHNHYDHLDLATLERLVTRDDPQIFTPLGNDTIIHKRIPTAIVKTGDWGDALSHRNKLRVHFEPCQHWSARGTNDRKMALWSAFVIETPSHKIFHIGDTGFGSGELYRKVAIKHGLIDLAVLPIGAYEPQWFMKLTHQNPAEAVAGLKLCKARYAIGHHWGTFQLTNEKIDAPKKALAVALKKQKFPLNKFTALHPGQLWELPSV